MFLSGIVRLSIDVPKSTVGTWSQDKLAFIDDRSSEDISVGKLSEDGPPLKLVPLSAAVAEVMVADGGFGLGPPRPLPLGLSLKNCFLQIEKENKTVHFSSHFSIFPEIVHTEISNSALVT